MRKLRIFEHISLDGIIQHSADENNFPYADWSAAYRSPEGRDALAAAYGDRYDLLLGRRTYDAWSGFWPKAPSGPFTDKLNAATKFIVTHHPDTFEWGPFEAVGPDLVEGVRRIKSQDAPDLILCGSSTLTSTLIQHDLVDELVLIVSPLLLGTGKRLFAEGTPAHKFTLASTQSFPTGIVFNSYKPAGALKTT
jgi:dihydrofolate reductase